MRFTIVLWVIVPDVALMVTVDAPAGVDGTKTSLELEQPAIKPAETRRTPSRPNSRSWRCLPKDRRRDDARNALKGRRRAAVIPAVAAPRRVWG